ncbi:MAG: hypothetical protein HON65_15005 [Rhodospirillales bacterium]|nr:hypothetical protein [Rhodospirillales bacterium]
MPHKFLGVVFHARGFLYIAALLISFDYLQSFVNFQALVDYSLQMYDKRGWVFFALLLAFSIMETVFVLSFYFPGSVVLVTILLTFRDFPLANILPLLLAIWLGILAGVMFNYVLGRFFQPFVNRLGHTEILAKARYVLEKYGTLGAFFMAIHPNYIGAFYLASGIAKVDLKGIAVATFFGTLASIMIWTWIVINVSEFAMETSMNHTTFLSIACVIIGILYGVFKSYFAKQK